MASGSIIGSGNYIRLEIHWSSVAGTGGSEVSATLRAQNTNNSYWYAHGNKGYSITINDTEKQGSGAALSSQSNGYANLLSHSLWISYTGNKSISLSGYADFSNVWVNNLGTYLGTRSVSGSAALDHIGSIPSVPTCTAPTTQTVSELGTTIKIVWNKTSSYTSSGAGYWLDVSINGGSWSLVAQINNLDTLSYNYTIPAGQGGTYQFRVGAFNPVGNSNGHSYSGVVTRNSLSAPTIGNINTYNPYVTSTLNVPLSGGGQTNGGNICRMCALYYGDTWLWEANYNSTSWNNASIACTYAAAEYAAKIGNKAYSSGNFRIVAWTENANRSRSNYVTKYFTVNLNTDGGATPTLNPPNLNGGWGEYASTCFIAGITNLYVVSPNAMLRRAPSGTTISYNISVTGMSNINAQTGTFTNLSAGTKTITVTATDSRGLTVTASKTCIVQNYIAPTIKNIKAERLSNPNTSGKVTYTLTYSPIYANGSNGTNLNGISIQQMSKAGAEYVNYTSGTTITGLNTDLTYKITIRIADKVKPVDYVMDFDIIPTIKNAFSIRDWGIGVQCIPQLGYALDVNGKAIFRNNLEVSGQIHATGDIYGGNNHNRRLAYIDEIYPIGSIYMSINSTNPSTLFGGTWTQICGRFLIGVGANENNTTNHWGACPASTYNMKLGEMGGEAKHTLTTQELPRISGAIRFQSAGNTQGIVSEVSGVFKKEQISAAGFRPNNAIVEAGQARSFTMEFGDNQSHNNIPPYLAVYMWKRVG